MENQFFRSIQDELQRSEADAEFKPISVEDDLEAPMTVEDHVLTLRYAIRRLIDGTLENDGERFLTDEEMPKALNELVSKETHEKYEEILADFRKIADAGDLVDIDNEENSRSVETWIFQLTEDVKGKRGSEIDAADLAELEAQCWLLFEAMANVINTETVEKGVKAFYEGKNVKDLPDNERKKLKKKCVEELGKKYPLSKVELEILVDLIVAADGGEDYSFKILVETIARLWKEYQLGDKKKVISKIALGSLMGQALNSYAPAMFEGIIGSNGNFNFEVYAQYFGLEVASSLIGLDSEIRAAELAKAINDRISEKITNSLFFQEFEFVQGRTYGEIFSTLEKGKFASQQLLTLAVSQLAPMLAGIVMSLAFLTKVNPILGAVGLAGLPMMYLTAKKSNKRIWAIYESEITADKEIATHMGSIREGLEEVRASQDVVAVKEHMGKLLGKRDALVAEKMSEMAKAEFKQMVPFDISRLVAAFVGAILQMMGKISGGAVLANIWYAERLSSPIQRLVKLYFGAFSRYVQDIKRMEEILGKYEDLDLPEGEKERERISVEELADMNISVKDLNFKGILQGVNVDIKEGEFVTIVGGSGDGKSTLLRLLAGLYKPDDGVIEFGGTELQKIKKYGQHSIYSRMSYCNQSPQIFAELSLRENLVLWSKAQVPDERIIKVMKDLHLDKFVDKLDVKVKHFSRGERVRIGFARTLIKGAQVLLLDEPTASLDDTSGAEVIKVIEDIRRDYPNVTIICVTHDKELMKQSQRKLNIAHLQKKKEA